MADEATAVTDWDAERDAKDQTFGAFLRGLLLVWRLCASEHKAMVRAFGWMIVITLTEIGFWFGVKRIGDQIPSAAVHHALGSIPWILLVLAGLKLTGLFTRTWLYDEAYYRFLIRLENLWPELAHRTLLGWRLDRHERESMGRNVSKVIKGCDRVLDVVMTMFDSVLPTLLFWTFNTIVLCSINLWMGLILLLPVIPAFYINRRVILECRPMWNEYEDTRDKTVALFVQSVLNIQTVQGYVQERKEDAKHHAMREKMAELDIEVCFRANGYFFFFHLAKEAGYFAAVTLAIILAITGHATLGAALYVLTTGQVVVKGMSDLLMCYRKISRHLIAAERFDTLLATSVESNGVDGGERHPMPPTSDLVCEALAYRYNGKQEDSLASVDLKIPAGAMIALVGRSGAGKTTLVKLLTQLYSKTGGRLLIGGVDVAKISSEEYRALFAYVKQDVELFDDTIRTNIAYGTEDATDDDVWRAAKAAHLSVALSDKRRFPEGLNTLVGERGVKVSGGEKQRIGIARAYLRLLHGAKFLILDEATSSLDSEAERAIQGMIEMLRKEREITIIAIAHRLSTVKHADRIFVLDEGRVHETGTHAELVRRQGIYAGLVAAQTLSNEPVAEMTAN